MRKACMYKGLTRSVDSKAPCTPSRPHRAILSLQLIDSVASPAAWDMKFFLYSQHI